MASRVVGYYASWTKDYTLEDLPAHLLTHLIYAFAVLDEKTLLMKQHDSGMDETRNYQRIVQLKRKRADLKVLVALGGWRDSEEGAKYSRLVSQPHRRRKFAKHAVTFLQEHGFDGLDLDWEFPGSGAKEGFTAWLQELRTAFAPHGLLLTAAVSAGAGVVDQAYDVPEVARLLDQIHLMSYDFHVPLEGRSGQAVAHHAPLHPRPATAPDCAWPGPSTTGSERGAPKDKIVVGVPTYGICWTLRREGNNKPRAPAVGPGRPSTFMTYTECTLAHQQSGWWLVKHKDGPYLTRGNQWVSYNDVDTVTKKAEYVLSRGLGGVMLWDITQDDFNDRCGGGRNPLLTAVSSTLRKEDHVVLLVATALVGVGGIVLSACLGCPCLPCF